jgi:carboxylate-amine ligase
VPPQPGAWATGTRVSVGMVTLGVEEEYLLLDPDSGLPLARSALVRAAAELAPTVDGGEVDLELLQAQVEVGTPICESLDEVEEHLTRLRAAVASAARHAGCRLAACGTPPLRGTAPVPVTTKPRYRSLAHDAPQLVDEQLINGMHVHAAIPDRESGVAVLNLVGPWLPVLLALGANSPLWDGGETGFASWRTVIFGRWPVSGPPPAFIDAADYQRRTQALLDTGAIRDRGQIYWQARLSERYPTIEIRVLDVQLEIQDAVTLAGVARALVTTALRDLESIHRLPLARREQADPELVAAAMWCAARYGMTERLVHPLTGRSVASLMEHLAPALAASGDLIRVERGVERLQSVGTGSQRQTQALDDGGPEAVLELITVRS